MFAHLMLFAAVAAAAPSPNPTDLYRSALKHLADIPQPSYIDMTAHWKVLAESPNGGGPSAFDERVLFDSTARRECVLFVPYSSDSRVIIGQSYFAPDMWLIRRPRAGTPEPRATQQPNFAPDLSDVKTIASVVSVAKPSYIVTLAGVDPITNGGGTAYHLKLQPTSDPAKHNLRELWINSANFNIMRAVLEGDYRPDPRSLLERTTVAEDFGSVGPYWVVIHHTWTYRDAADGVDFSYDVTGTNMSFPALIPAWYFDERQFAAHRNEVNTSSSWP